MCVCACVQFIEFRKVLKEFHGGRTGASPIEGLYFFLILADCLLFSECWENYVRGCLQNKSLHELVR